MKTVALSISFVVISALMISCKKEITIPGIRDLPLSPRLQAVADITKEVATILEKVYQDREAYLEVNAAIFSGYYADERVLLTDMLEPESSELYSSEEFSKYQVEKGIFKQRFHEALASGNYPMLKAQLGVSDGTVNTSALTLTPYTGTSSLVTINNVSIYFPYAEDFGMNGVITLQSPATLVFSDRDADSGPGREPYLCGNLKAPCYREVSVDDAYASARPTHIVGMGAEVQPKVAMAEAAATSVNRVYHGWSRLTRQMDRLISFTGNGGGSEIKLGRISAFLKATNQQVTGFSGDLVTVQFTRGDIRKDKWKRIFSIWDPNWSTEDKEEIYAVYEDDTEGTAAFSGSLTTTVNVALAKVVGEIGFDVKVKTQDEILTQRKLDRASYYKGALMNQGWGFVRDDDDFLENSQDWPIYDGGAVWQYSLANREF